MKVEQDGERIHKRLNDLVRKFNKKGKKDDMLAVSNNKTCWSTK